MLKGKKVIEEENLPEQEEKVYEIETKNKKIKFTLPIKFYTKHTGIYDAQIEEEKQFIEDGVMRRLPGFSVQFQAGFLDVNDFETAKKIIQSRFFEDTIFIWKAGMPDEGHKTEYVTGPLNTASMKERRKA